MLNPSSAAGHHRRSAYCAVLAEFRQIEVTIVGGRIDDSSQSCIGEHGRKLLRSVYPNIAFMSCNSWG